jgi:hypothetical protein
MTHKLQSINTEKSWMAQNTTSYFKLNFNEVRGFSQNWGMTQRFLRIMSPLVCVKKSRTGPLKFSNPTKNIFFLRQEKIYKQALKEFRSKTKHPIESLMAQNLPDFFTQREPQSYISFIFPERVLVIPSATNKSSEKYEFDGLLMRYTPNENHLSAHEKLKNKRNNLERETYLDSRIVHIFDTYHDQFGLT